MSNIGLDQGGGKRVEDKRIDLIEIQDLELMRFGDRLKGRGIKDDFYFLVSYFIDNVYQDK